MSEQDEFPAVGDLPPEIEERAKLAPADREWPRDWMGVFLRSLQVIPDDHAASKIAGVSLTTVRLWKKRSPEFAESVVEASAFQRAHYERIMHQWATSGLPVEEVREEETVDADGKRTIRRWTTRKAIRSERVAVKLLESWYPERYAQPSRHEHSGPGGGPIQMSTLAEIDAQIEALHKELADRAGSNPVPTE